MAAKNTKLGATKSTKNTKVPLSLFSLCCLVIFVVSYLGYCRWLKCHQNPSMPGLLAFSALVEQQRFLEELNFIGIVLVDAIQEVVNFSAKFLKFLPLELRE